MKYNLIVSYDSGSTVVWNQTKDKEWRVTFESMEEAQAFMINLLLTLSEGNLRYGY